MMLARGVKRWPEFAIRQSLGASTARLLRQVLTESMVLVAAAGVAGVLLAVSGLRLLVALAPSNLPRLDEVAVDAVVLIYATAVSVGVGILFAVAPVFGLGRSSLQESLRAGGSHAHRVGAHGARKLLIVIQFALAIVLVFGASLLVRSLMMARSVDPGFQTENVLMANLSVESAANRIAFYEEVVREVRTIPGVVSSGIVEDLWISGAPSRSAAAHSAVSVLPEPVGARTSVFCPAAIAGTSRTMMLMLMSIASISLFVGGIGIMNILLVSVTERTKEIGLRMAVGAKRRHILLQFLIEGIIMTVIGGVLGVLGGVGAARVLTTMVGWPTIISWQAMAAAFVFSVAVGLFFGLYPANKASKLNPIEALHYE